MAHDFWVQGEYFCNIDWKSSYAKWSYVDCFSLFSVDQHRWIKDYKNHRDVLDLISESKAEVMETMEDLTEEEELKEMKVKSIKSGISPENV